MESVYASIFLSACASARIVSYQMEAYIFRTPLGAMFGLPRRYYGPINSTNKEHTWNITIFNLDGLGWQWYDSTTNEGNEATADCGWARRG